MPEAIDIVAAADPVLEVVAEHAIIGANALVRSSDGEDGPILFSQQIEPGSMFTLPMATVLKRDGVSQQNVEYIPGAEGFIYTEDPIIVTKLKANDVPMQDVEPGTDEVLLKVLSTDNSPVGEVESEDTIRIAKPLIVDRNGGSHTPHYKAAADGEIYQEADILPSKVRVNGVDRFTGLGENEDTNVFIVDSADNQCGTWDTGKQRIADSTVKSAASSPLYSVPVVSEQTLTLPKVRIVDRYGVNNDVEYRPFSTSPVWTEAANSGALLNVTASSVTPSFGDSITLTATPSGFTPTSYTWFANGIQIGMGAVLSWTVDQPFTVNILCVGTDGVSSATGTTALTVSLVTVTSLDLDGVNDRAFGQIRQPATFAQADTWSFWLKGITLGTGYRGLIECGLSTVNGFLWILAKNGSNFELRFGDISGYYPYSTAYTDNVWHHFLISRRNNGTTTTLLAWINGVSFANGSVGANTGSNATHLLKFNPPGSPNDRCKVTKFSHYTGLANSTDAAQLYNGGVPLTNPITTTGNLTLNEYFPFTEAPQVPSTNYGSPTIIKGINGSRIMCNANFASPFGLVTDIP